MLQEILAREKLKIEKRNTNQGEYGMCGKGFKCRRTKANLVYDEYRCTRDAQESDSENDRNRRRESKI